ncbi:phosphotransferase family protein [Streptomyces sp. CA-146814]|uniref:phosphotransferase family protein n=1 Tax=Streptomyces sp. CA-146814 TaxID=3240053 RepID=UPI003D9023EE
MSDQTSTSPLPRILRSLGVGDRGLASATPLTGGTYNTVTRVTLTDGRDWVVKTPPPHSGGLRYERNLLVNEATFYTAAAQAGIRGSVIPHVVHSEPDPTAPTGAYLVMTACPGRPWYELDAAEDAGDKARLRDEARLRTELGCLVGRLHTITGSGGFGYPAAPFGPPAATWRTAFTAMTEAVLADAVTYRAPLPYPVDRIRTVLAHAAPVLDDVTRPALVHFDLWQGNLLVTGEPGARAVGGIIDGERMFWGDPVADFVSLALFGELEEDREFLTGYAEGSGRAVEFSDSVRLRLALYRSYLYLIMLVETVPRGVGSEAAEETRQLVAPHLVAALDAVSRAANARSGG